MTSTDDAATRRVKLLTALSVVYFVWGSTFLAGRYAVETLPPLMITAARCLVAGTLLYAFYYRRSGHPTRRQWQTAWVAGTLLFLGGQGTMTRALKIVPSGLAALLLASMPIWMVLFHWAQPSGRRPTAREAIGLAIGLLGVALLASPAGVAEAEMVEPLGAFMLLLAAMLWAVGSLYSRGAALPASGGMATAMQLLAGGVSLSVASVLVGEPGAVASTTITFRSAASLVYLVILGTLIGFSAFNWLLKNTTPALLGSYAYVNPVVAVLVGWAVGGEALGPRTLIAMVVVVAGVAIVVARPRGALRKPPLPE